MDKLKLIEEKYKKSGFPQFQVGDTIKVFVKIPEGPDKTRLHPFEGIVIAKKGRGMSESFTVRKVSYGEGIERVFPLNSVSIEKIDVLRPGKVKRAKIYYLRRKIGKKATKIEARKDTKQEK
jgi:large subunit ribosomal protein L19